MENFGESLRKNVWLIFTACFAFMGSAIIGYTTVDAGSTTPGVWLAMMWVMMAIAIVLLVVVALEAINAFTK